MPHVQGTGEGMNSRITPSQLKAIFIHAKQSAIDLFADPINAVMEKYNIDTSLRMAHFLAQIGHESGELRYREEIASGAAYEDRKDLGNTQKGDGRLFKGRGLIQLTGRANYAAYGNDIGVDLLAYPSLVASDDMLCVGVAGWYWNRKGLNKYADVDDIVTITKRINGGLNGIQERRRLLILAKEQLKS